MHIHDFQLLTASIMFAYDVVFRPVHWPIQLTCMFSKRLCPWTSRTRRCTHTESSANCPYTSVLAGVVLPPEVPFHFCSLAECQVQSKLKPCLSSPYDLFKRRIRNGSLWADVCHCEKVLEHCRKPVFRLATTGLRAANGSCLIISFIIIIVIVVVVVVVIVIVMVLLMWSWPLVDPFLFHTYMSLRLSPLVYSAFGL